MYFVIGKNISRDPAHYGMQVIFSEGVAYPYGKFYERYGYVTRHKAEVAIEKLKRLHMQAAGFSSTEQWVYSIVDETIEEKRLED